MEWLEQYDEKSIKNCLGGINYYYTYNVNKDMQKLAGSLRQDRIKPRPYLLKNFRGVDINTINKLEARSAIRKARSLPKIVDIAGDDL